MHNLNIKLLEQRWIILTLICLISPLSLTNCINTPEGEKKTEGESTEVGNTTVQIKSKSVSTSNTNSNAVCDPFNNTASISREHGLTGELTYLPPNLPQYSAVEQYLANGIKIDANLFFNQVNVPTRPFDQGFYTQSGVQLTTPDNNPLYEWFALRLKSTLKLSSNDRSGRYQFALLSDDGSILKIRDGANFRTLINNDGTHASKLACSTDPIQMDASTELPIEIDYYQGPRYHIALILLWREWPENEATQPVLDPACGKSGNQTFFDSNYTPSKIMPTWQGMLDRGWKAIPVDNFYLPTTVNENPCSSIPETPTENPSDATNNTDTNTNTNTDTNTNTGGNNNNNNSAEDFIIVGFDATTDTNSIFIIWQTPGYSSTSQILYGTDPNNLNQSTTIDTNLTEIHQVTINGLLPQTQYYLQSISVEPSGRVIQSNIISKTTK